MTWLIATLLAALFQPWRTAVQQRARARLSLNGAGLVRYFYGLPVALLLLAGYGLWRGALWPGADGWMLVWSLAAGLAQILGTNMLLMAFGYRNYLVGTAYSKTEAIQGAILSMLLIGERLSPVSWAGIGVGVVGVLLLAGPGAGREDARKAGWARLAEVLQPAALCGLAAGLGFTFTSICVKLATRHVGGHDTIHAALVVLAVVQAGQVAMQGGYLLWREPDELTRVVKSWRQAAPVGLLSSLGSACWFTGFALAPVALVRTVGQVEVAFTLGFSHFYLKEAVRRQEIVALFCVALGVALALAGGL